MRFLRRCELFFFNYLLFTDGVLGSQMLGAGLGGTVAALVEKDKADSVLQKLKNEYYDKHGFPMMADVYLPSGGSGVRC